MVEDSDLIFFRIAKCGESLLRVRENLIGKSIFPLLSDELERLHYLEFKLLSATHMNAENRSQR